MAATKTELFAWRNKGYDDVNAGRPITPALQKQPASVKSVYLAGRRAALNERDKTAAA